MTIVEMRVYMDCAGCESKIKKALQKLQGVDEIDIDMEMQKVTVTGWAEQRKVLKAVRKTGKRAELWPYPYNPEYHDYTHRYNYYNQQHFQSHPYTYYATTQPASSSSSSSYNYRKHGYDGHDHGYYQPPPYSTIFDERTGAVFSDDNPNACSIM
ncbi:PREDICTED: heavy metal-associated isoprenylated plant protein 20-like isoform X2 [Nelumbo nucifera]|uniref:Heavy metal-associated isoprenylated plant protein 20-like isoform X2 n=1 Tax=Nelumbo nucifera TaxID=4432 RepID=A0A1U8BB98_NELNU|nr:PREDICTED: heavy metal-associated isoprenylated plant protein 20-like isoform X2 [Nelumbo nucifera]